MFSCLEVALQDYRDKYGIITRFRIVPKTANIYKLYGKSFFSYEYDEICVANDSMPFEDYLECRIFNLTIEIFYNDGIFSELINVLKKFDVSVSAFILEIHEHIKSLTTPISALFEEYLHESKELSESKKALQNYLNQPSTQEKSLSGEYGINEQLVYRAVAIFTHMDHLHEIAFNVGNHMLKQKKVLDEGLSQYLTELADFSLLKKSNLLSRETCNSKPFHFDFTKIARHSFDKKLIENSKKGEYIIRFYHDDAQKKLLSKYINIYGVTNYGLGNILSNASHLSKLYRKVSVDLE